MQVFNGDTRIGMVYPTGVTESHDVLFPSFQHEEPAYAAAITVEANAAHTLVEPAELTGALTLNITPNVNLRGGERLTAKVLSDGSARTVTLGTGIAGPALTTVAGRTHCAEFIFDGTGFVQVSAWVQID